MIIALTDDIQISIVQKAVKNIHLSVYPPQGEVKMVAPSYMNEESLKLYAISKLSWIKQERRKFQEQPRESQRLLIQQESVYLWGERYLLEVIHEVKRPKIVFDALTLKFYCPKSYTIEQRTHYYQCWARKQLRACSLPMIQAWSDKLAVQVNQLFISYMKTRWGSCNARDKNIRLNSELVKKPKECVEYIIVHELLHLIESNHNDYFIRLLDVNMPNWRQRKKLLADMPTHY